MKGVLFVLATLFYAGLTQAHWNYYAKEGDPCHHYSPPCREKTLVSEQVTPCNNSTCNGPNVCITTRTYTKHYYSSFYKNVCRQRYSWWRRRNVQVCNLECEVSSTCNVTKNKTVTDYHCCKGFTTNNTHHGSYNHYWTRESHWFLKRYGCPIVVHESVFDCLNELGLTEFSGLISDSLQDQLDSNSTRPKYTIFGAPNELVTQQFGNLSDAEIDIKIRSHIVMRQIPSDYLYNGMKKRTLADGRFIFVSETYENSNMWSTRNTKTYINCNPLIAQDACQAENGVVHVIQGVVCSSDQTIAQILETTPTYSVLASLFRKVNLTSALNATHGYPLTFFLPTNEAFQNGNTALNINLEQCLNNNFTTTELTQFLKFHYACNVECSSVLATKTELQSEACTWKWTRRGHYWGSYRYRTCKPLRVNVNDEGIEIGTAGSSISQTDIPASNGVIHTLTLPLVNPCFNLTEKCSGFRINPIQ